MIQGSCLCGSVAFEATKLSSPIGHCHCTTCRKAHGAAFATTARVERPDFRWTRGVEFLRSFESSPGKLRHFCGTCGTQLMAEWVDQPEVILRLGALDATPCAAHGSHLGVRRGSLAGLRSRVTSVLRWSRQPPVGGAGAA